MGNTEAASTHETTLKNFQMQKYLNRGLNQQQIVKIKQAFDSYQPRNGYISTRKLRARTEQSGSREMIDKYLDGRENLNFDDFFEISKDIVEKQIKRDPGLLIDTSEVQATCLFCPYTEDRPAK